MLDHSMLPVSKFKWCYKCKKHKPLDRFQVNKRTKQGRKGPCKECQAEWYRIKMVTEPDFRTKNAKTSREGWTRRQLTEYGLTQEEFDKLTSKGCMICGGPPNGRGRYVFDHDHTTGAFRGLLCSRCNVGLGHFLDDPVLLTKALKYLQKHQE